MHNVDILIWYLVIIVILSALDIWYFIAARSDSVHCNTTSPYIIPLYPHPSLVQHTGYVLSPTVTVHTQCCSVHASGSLLCSRNTICSDLSFTRTSLHCLQPRFRNAMMDTSIVTGTTPCNSKFCIIPGTDLPPTTIKIPCSESNAPIIKN